MPWSGAIQPMYRVFPRALVNNALYYPLINYFPTKFNRNRYSPQKKVTSLRWIWVVRISGFSSSPWTRRASTWRARSTRYPRVWWSARGHNCSITSPSVWRFSSRISNSRMSVFPWVSPSAFLWRSLVSPRVYWLGGPKGSIARV